MKRFRVSAALLLCLMVLFAGARAEEPRGLRLELTCDAETLPSLSGDALAAAREGLAALRLRLTAGEDRARMTLLYGDNETLLDVCSQGEMIWFPLSGNAYMTDKDALTGSTPDIPEVYLLPGRYPAVAAKMFGALEAVKPGKAVQKSTTVKNAAAAASRAEYALTGEEMTALRPALLKEMEPDITAVLGEAAGAVLDGLTFSGDWSVKRLLDADGQDMGIQATGKGGPEGDIRKITLQYGFTENKGGHFSLSAPAVKGKNTFKLVCDLKISAKSEKTSYTLDGSYTRKLGEEAASAEWEGKLQITPSETGEEWAGSLMISSNFGQKAVYTLRPQLTRDETGLHGDVRVQKKQGKTETLDVTLHLMLSEETGEMPPVPAVVNRLTGLSDETAAQVLSGEMQGLSRALLRWLGALPPETRTQLTHQLHGENWLTRQESVPPLTEITEDPWTVKEDER